jgi:hypothetical protein
MQTLPPLVDVQDTLALLANDRTLESLDSARELVSKWRSRLPSADRDDLPVWHEAVAFRLLCFDKLREVCV